MLRHTPSLELQMAKKRDLLSALTRENLIDLATLYDVEIDRTGPKASLVEALAISHRIKTEGVDEIVSKIRELGNVPAAVLQSRQGFFEATAIAAFDQIDSVSDSLSVAVAAYEVIEPGFTGRLRTQLDSLRNTRILKEHNVPNHIWSQLSPRQKKAFGTATKLANMVPYFVGDMLASSDETDLVRGQKDLNSRGLPPPIDYYVVQAYRASVSQCYDSSIVMIARALEHLLKRSLSANSVSFPENATLGGLVGLYKKHLADNEALQKILEVSNMDRIICAHDVPPHYRAMDKKDAAHAWTALEVVLREIPPL